MSKLAELPNELRSVLLLLVAVEDLSYAEAGKVLDIPVGTVMSRHNFQGARRLLLRKWKRRANVASNKVAHLRERQMNGRPITPKMIFTRSSILRSTPRGTPK